MSKNIFQVYTTNPITTNQSTDLMYFGRSPYGIGDDAGMTFGDFAAQFGSPFTPSALTKNDDSNITLTLGGTPSTSLLQSVSLTLGWTGQLSPSRGGTGVNNGTNTLTLGGNLTTLGAFASTFTMTGATNVTFPTSGTLATTSQIPSVTPSALTEVNDTNVTMTLGGTPATALLQAVSMTLGWTGQLSPARGGTGVNNGTSTLTLGGNLTTSGAFNSTFTITGATNVTFPTSGTLATVGGTVSSITGTANQVIASASTGAVTLSLPQSIATSSAVQFASVSFSSTSGIIGTTTNNNAAAGSQGEFISSVIPNSIAVSLTSGVAANVTSITLTAGDWDVWGNVNFNFGGTGTTNTVYIWISSTSATLPSLELYASLANNVATEFAPGNTYGGAAPSFRFSLAGTTTIYLGAEYVKFTSTATASASGGIYARRRR